MLNCAYECVHSTLCPKKYFARYPFLLYFQDFLYYVHCTFMIYVTLEMSPFILIAVRRILLGPLNVGLRIEQGT
jgi:hypothetical protein